eukprot:scaffold3853_cov118-Isochrysis_galbana.AAC.2
MTKPLLLREAWPRSARSSGESSRALRRGASRRPRAWTSRSLPEPVATNRFFAAAYRIVILSCSRIYGNVSKWF